MKADFYQHLKAARKLRGLSQKELVEWLRSDAPYLFEGLDVNGLSRWETGKVNPSPERMVRVLRVLEYSVDELKLCRLPNKAQLMKRMDAFLYRYYGAVALSECEGRWRALCSEGRGRQFLNQLRHLERYERLVSGQERTEQWAVQGSVLASLSYRVEGAVFILVHVESSTHAAFFACLERLIELVYQHPVTHFLMITPEVKAQSMARILSLQEIEINGSSCTYFANADYVLGKWLTVLSWRESPALVIH